jgi:hypothetical protein
VECEALERSGNPLLTGAAVLLLHMTACALASLQGVSHHYIPDLLVSAAPCGWLCSCRLRFASVVSCGSAIALFDANGSPVFAFLRAAVAEAFRRAPRVIRFAARVNPCKACGLYPISNPPGPARAKPAHAMLSKSTDKQPSCERGSLDEVPLQSTPVIYFLN